MRFAGKGQSILSVNVACSLSLSLSLSPCTHTHTHTHTHTSMYTNTCRFTYKQIHFTHNYVHYEDLTFFSLTICEKLDHCLQVFGFCWQHNKATAVVHVLNRRASAASTGLDGWHQCTDCSVWRRERLAAIRRRFRVDNNPGRSEFAADGAVNGKCGLRCTLINNRAYPIR